jgi:hypothetical protein
MNKTIKKATGKVALVNLDKFNFKTKIKQVIVYLACWGLMPIGLASLLIGWNDTTELYRNRRSVEAFSK